MATSKLINAGAIVDRIHALDWNSIGVSLFSSGFALTPPILSGAECDEIAEKFGDDSLFRSVTNMAHKRFGSGVYKYFKYPLPDPITDMRNAIYEHVAPIANSFNEALGVSERFPARHSELIKECNELGQMRPTPLLLHYEQGDFNCLHQDIYGTLTFPLQITAFLSRPEIDYQGGEFLILEQASREQARVHALKPKQGEMIIFTTRHRPEKRARGFRRVNVKHGVATVESGKRDTMGIIFHDAK